MAGPDGVESGEYPAARGIENDHNKAQFMAEGQDIIETKAQEYDARAAKAREKIDQVLQQRSDIYDRLTDEDAA